MSVAAPSFTRDEKKIIVGSKQNKKTKQNEHRVFNFAEVFYTSKIFGACFKIHSTKSNNKTKYCSDFLLTKA